MIVVHQEIMGLEKNDCWIEENFGPPVVLFEKTHLIWVLSLILLWLLLRSNSFRNATQESSTISMVLLFSEFISFPGRGWIFLLPSPSPFFIYATL